MTEQIFTILHEVYMREHLLSQSNLMFVRPRWTERFIVLVVFAEVSRAGLPRPKPRKNLLLVEQGEWQSERERGNSAYSNCVHSYEMTRARERLRK